MKIEITNPINISYADLPFDMRMAFVKLVIEAVPEYDDEKNISGFKVNFQEVLSKMRKHNFAAYLDLSNLGVISIINETIFIPKISCREVIEE